MVPPLYVEQRMRETFTPQYLKERDMLIESLGEPYVATDVFDIFQITPDTDYIQLKTNRLVVNVTPEMKRAPGYIPSFGDDLAANMLRVFDETKKHGEKTGYPVRNAIFDMTEVSPFGFYRDLLESVFKIKRNLALFSRSNPSSGPKEIGETGVLGNTNLVLRQLIGDYQSKERSTKMTDLGSNISNIASWLPEVTKLPLDEKLAAVLHSIEGAHTK